MWFGKFDAFLFGGKQNLTLILRQNISSSHRTPFRDVRGERKLPSNDWSYFKPFGAYKPVRRYYFTLSVWIVGVPSSVDQK